MSMGKDTRILENRIKLTILILKECQRHFLVVRSMYPWRSMEKYGHVEMVLMLHTTNHVCLGTRKKKSGQNRRICRSNMAQK